MDIIKDKVVKYYKNHGVFRTNDIFSPKLLDLEEQIFPFGVEIILCSFRSDSTLTHSFFGNKRIVINPVRKLQDESMRYQKNIMNGFDIIKKYKSVSSVRIKDFRTNPEKNNITILDYSYILATYSFSTGGLNSFKYWNDINSSIIDNINDTIFDHIMFLAFPLPDTLLDFKELKKMMRFDNEVLSRKVSDYRIMNLVNLFKFVNGEKSIYSKIDKDKYDNLYIIFTNGKKMILLSMLKLMAMFDKNFDGMRRITPIQLISGLYLSFIKLKNSPVSVATEEENENETPIVENSNVEEEISEEELETRIEKSELLIEEGLKEYNQATVSPEQEIVEEKEEYFKKDESFMSEDLRTALNELSVSITEKDVKAIKGALKKREANKDKLDIDYAEDDILIDERVFVDNSGVVFDKLSSSNKSIDAERAYVKKLFRKDMTKSIMGMEKKGIIVTNLEVTPHKDAVSDFEEYKISMFVPGYGEHTQRQFIPTIKEDGTFKVYGNQYRLREHISDMPIRKISISVVVLTSNFSKIFVESDIENDKNIKASVAEKTEFYLEVARNKTPSDVTMSKLYIKSSNVFSYYRIKDYDMFFVYRDRFSISNTPKEKILEIESKGYILCGMLRNDNDSTKDAELFVDIKTDRLFRYDGKKLIEDISLYELIGVDETEDKTYSYASMMGDKIPVIVILINILGFRQTMAFLNIDYTVNLPSRNHHELENDEMLIRFADKHVLLSGVNEESKLILNGVVKKHIYLKSVNFELEGSTGLGNMNEILGFPRSLFKRLKFLNKMFIDDITLSVLKELKQPTTFVGIIKEANRLLTVNSVKFKTDMSDVRLRGHERIAGIMYSELAKAIGSVDNYSSFGAKPPKVKPYAVWDRLSKDVALKDDLNPYADVRQASDLSYLVEGRPKEAMTLDTRIFHDSSLGVISVTNRDNGDAGITRFKVNNPRINNSRGFIDISDAELEPSEVYDSILLTIPNMYKDDSKRANFIQTQGVGVIPIDGEMTLPLRTGYETTIGNIVSENMCVNALTDVKVINIKETAYIVVADVKTKVESKYFLGNYTTRPENKSSHTHRIITMRKVGDIIKAGENITYNSAFFQPDFFYSKQVSMKTGKLARTRFKESQETYEDSIGVHASLLSKLSAKKTKITDVTIMSNQHISGIKNIGDRVEANEPAMLITGQAIDESKWTDEKVREILTEMKTDIPKYSIGGNIVKIECLYRCELKDMTPSLRKIAKLCDEQRMDTEGVSGRVTTKFSISGKTMLDNEVFIAIYIESDLYPAQIADKTILSAQLKNTIGSVYEGKGTGLEGDEFNTYDEDGNLIELTYSPISTDKRIVNSTNENGIYNLYLSKVSLGIKNVK